MNVEDNLDSDNFYDFWQLSGCAIVLCHNVRHISKITTERVYTKHQLKTIQKIEHDLAYMDYAMIFCL